MTIHIDELQNEILKTLDVNRLYEIQIDLSKMIKNAHRQNIMATTVMEQSEAKGDLGIYNTMMEVIQNRVEELKEIDRADRNEQGRINYNFRAAAKGILKRETFNHIMDLANRTIREIKEDNNGKQKIQ